MKINKGKIITMENGKAVMKDNIVKVSKKEMCKWSFVEMESIMCDYPGCAGCDCACEGFHKCKDYEI